MTGEAGGVARYGRFELDSVLVLADRKWRIASGLREVVDAAICTTAALVGAELVRAGGVLVREYRSAGSSVCGSLHEAPGMSLGVLDGDLSYAVVARPWRFELDTCTDEVLVDAVHVIDEETDPGAETAGVVLPVRYGSVQPNFALADDQLNVADDTVVVWPPFALDESQDIDTPVGHSACVRAEHVRDNSSNLDVWHVATFQLL